MATKKPILTLKRISRSEGARSSGAFLEDLQARAPALWNEDRPVPLAVGMHRQLFPLAEARQMSRSDVRRFLKGWTSRPGYLRALAEPGACRMNLDGSPAGEVSARDRARAQARLERLTDAPENSAQTRTVL